MDLDRKRQEEQKMLRLMIRIYCRGKHGNTDVLCEDCETLLDYALQRTEKCPFMETKTFCSACKVHCYAPYMREKVRIVMKYAGPRMLLYHPVLAVKHMRVTLLEKKKQRNT